MNEGICKVKTKKLKFDFEVGEIIKSLWELDELLEPFVQAYIEAKLKDLMLQIHNSMITRTHIKE